MPYLFADNLLIIEYVEKNYDKNINNIKLVICLHPISSILSSRYSTSIVANIDEVVLFARK